MAINKSKLNIPIVTNALNQSPEIISLDAIPAASDIPKSNQLYRWNEIKDEQWIIKLRDSSGKDHEIKEDIGVISDYINDTGEMIDYNSNPQDPYEIYSEGLLENNQLTIQNVINITGVGLKTGENIYTKIIPKNISINYSANSQTIDFGDLTIDSEIIVWYATGNVILSGGTMSAFNKVGISESTMTDKAMLYALLFN